jgi:DNA-directed RNA polymerase specialized sigma24 family protein
MQRTISRELETALERIAPRWTQWDAWTRREPALAGLTYQDLRVELRTGTEPRKDELLAALVRTSNRDRTAFDVVAACLLPGIRHLVARYGRSLERQEALAIAVGALYEAVGRCKLDQSPRFVASKLLALPTGRLRRAVTAQRAWCITAAPSAENTAHTHSPELSTTVLLGTAVEAAVLAEHDARLIHATRVIGWPMREVAHDLGVSYGTAKKRRQRAEAAWVAWWAPERCGQRSRR